MFNIGLSEILMVALVSIIVLDKKKIPVFIDFIKTVYRYVITIKSKANKLLKDAGIEDLYKEYSTEEVHYITGKNGKLYPAYNTSQKNDSKGPSSR